MVNVVFAHNVYNRLRTLKDTISIEKNVFPDAHISVAYNDIFINIFQDISNFNAVSFKQREHKIGCVNGCILSIKQLLSIDFDVLVFSHDDVRINERHLDVVKKHINSIYDGEYDCICRQPLNGYGTNYYLMEVFYLSKNAAIKIFSELDTINNEIIIPVDIRGSISPEVYLFDIINKHSLKINEIKYQHNDNTYNIVLGETMGYYHLNAGLRGWRD